MRSFVNELVMCSVELLMYTGLAASIGVVARLLSLHHH
jgi:hypothetical protein